MTIDPGKRDQRVTVRSIPTAKSATGTDIAGDPVTVSRTYACIKLANQSKMEFFTGEKLATRTVYELELPYIAGLADDMEILWEVRNVLLDILQIQDLGQRHLNIKILAQEQR